MWSTYPVVADAVRDSMRRTPAALGVERLADDDTSVDRFDVGLVLHDDLASPAPARLLRHGIPVLQLSDDAGQPHGGVRVLPTRAALPTIVRAIEGLAHEASGTVDRSPLSVREAQVATLYAEGESIAGVAARLGLGLESVRTYLRRARAKLRADGHAASTQAELAALHEFGMIVTRPLRTRRTLVG